MQARKIAAQADPFVSVDRARVLIGREGKPVARGTVLAACLKGDLDCSRAAGRLVITRASIAKYASRRAQKSA